MRVSFLVLRGVCADAERTSRTSILDLEARWRSEDGGISGWLAAGDAHVGGSAREEGVYGR